MVGVSLNGKRNARSNKNDISKLVKRVKSLKLKNLCHLIEANELTKLILEQWRFLRDKQKKACEGKRKLSLRTYEHYKAEEEIIAGLLILMNEKIICYFTRYCDY